jgi:hypothetical protein
VGFAVVPPALVNAIVLLKGEVLSVGGNGPGMAVAGAPRNHLGCTLIMAEYVSAMLTVTPGALPAVLPLSRGVHPRNRLS